MSTSVVTMLSALATQSIRLVLDNPSAAIHVLQCDLQTLAISNVLINPGSWTKGSFGEWTLFLAGQLLAKLSELRAAKLPNETGGVLIGLYDLDRKFIYVVDTVPSPPDSAEWPTLYIRGAEGLLLEVEIFSKRTSGQLEYIGEWHSHPDKCPTLPSPDDIKVFAWLTEHMSVAGLPALMAIVGESNASSWFLGEMKESGGWSI